MEKTSRIIKILIALTIIAVSILVIVLVVKNTNNKNVEIEEAQNGKVQTEGAQTGKEQAGEKQTGKVQTKEAQTVKVQTGEKETEVKKNEKTENTSKPEFVEEKNGIVYNSSKTLNSEKTYDGLKITNVKLTQQDKGNSVLLLADVENTSGKDTKEKEIKLIFIDKDKKEIANIKAILAPIKAGERTQLNTKLTNPNLAKQVVNAYDFIIK